LVATVLDPVREKTSIKLDWTNNDAAILHTIVEVKEGGALNNWFTYADFADPIGSTHTVTMPGFFKDAAYDFRVRTITSEGSTYSTVCTVSAGENAFDEDTTIDESEGFSYDNSTIAGTVNWTDATGVAPPDREFFVRLADTPFPERWGSVGSSIADIDGHTGPLYAGRYAIQGSSTEFAESPKAGTLADVVGTIFNGSRSFSSFTGSILSSRGTSNNISISSSDTGSDIVRIFDVNTGETIAIGSTSFSGKSGTPSSRQTSPSEPLNPLDRFDYYSMASVDDLDEPTSWSSATEVLDLSRAFQPSVLSVKYESKLVNNTNVPAVRIFWDNTAYNESGYKLERTLMNSTHSGPDESAWTEVTTVGADITEAVDTGPAGGLKPAETYYYRVTALRAGKVNQDSVPSEAFILDIPWTQCLICDIMNGSSPGQGAAPAPTKAIVNGATADGQVSMVIGRSSSTGGGAVMANSTTWSNFSTAANPDFSSGNGTASGDLPHAELRKNGRVVITSGQFFVVFNPASSGYSGTPGNPYGLRVKAGNLVMSDGNGNQFTFSNFDSSGNGGTFLSYTDAWGHTITADRSTANVLVLNQTIDGDTLKYTYTSASTGLLTSLDIQTNAATTETYTYSYYGTSTRGNPNDLKNVIHTISDGAATQTDVSYMRYYTSADTGGYVGGLKYVVSGTSYDRLMAAIGSTDISTVDDSVIASYADGYYEYDSSGRVTKIVSQGNGCSICTAGLGTTTFSYTESGYTPKTTTQSMDLTGLTVLGTDPASVAYRAQRLIDLNTWRNKQVVTLPGFNFGNVSDPQNVTITTYTNFQGQIILKETTQNATGQTWREFHRFDSDGREIVSAGPAVVTGKNEGFGDLVNYGVAGNYLADSSGIMNYVDYDNGRVLDTYITNGDGASATKRYLTYNTYTFSAADSVIVYRLASSKVFSGDVSSAPSTSSGRVTSFSYDYYSGTNQIRQMTTTLPGVLATSNGSGVDVINKTYFDEYGHVIWTMDGNGRITGTTYDLTTGAIVSRTVDSTSGPSGWWTNANGASLTTAYGFDALGRATTVTDPAGHVSYTLYDDVHHAVYSFTVHSSGATISTAGPITMTRTDIPYSYVVGSTTYYGTYDESITFSGEISVSAGQPVIPGVDSTNGALMDLVGTGTTGSPQYKIQSLSRTLHNAAGQVIESDAYFNIDNATYLSSGVDSAYSGTAGTNYYATTYGYDQQGRQNMVKTPTGTITRSVYDAMGRVASTWVGTDDAGATHTDPSNGGANNMIMVQRNTYDSGNVGDGNLTQVNRYYDRNGADDTGVGATWNGGSAEGFSHAGDITQYMYDWRDRLVSQASGITTVTTQLSDMTINVLDNLGEVTSVFTLQGEFGLDVPLRDAPTWNSSSAVVIADANHNGVPDLLDKDGDGIPIDPDIDLDGFVDSSPTSFIWRKAGYEYDALGRVYRTTQFTVSSTHVIGTTGLVSNTWYDNNGQVIETRTSGGATSKTVYDGAGRVKVSFITDGGAVANSGTPLTTWEAANSVSRDIVLQQTEYAYDENGNVIQTFTRERFHDAGTTTGALAGPGASVAAPTIPTGSFEVDPGSTGRVYNPVGADWTFTGTSGIVANGAGIATVSTTVGTRAAFLGDGGAISQDVTFGAGAYVLKFQIARSGIADARIAVDIDGHALGIFTPGSTYTLLSTMAIGLSSGSHTLHFAATTDSSSTFVLLDNVTLTAAAAARVSYTTAYYDEANRTTATVNVGTNGGTIYTRPSTAPGRSDTVLVTSYAYNAAGELELVKDPRCLSTRTIYDNLGRTLYTIEAWDGIYHPGVAPYDLSTTVKPGAASVNRTTAYTYDGAGHTTSVTAVMPTGVHNQTTQYVYGVNSSDTISSLIDSNDLLFLIKYPDKSTGEASSSASDQVVFTYDAAGRVVTKNDQNGTLHLYGYDHRSNQSDEWVIPGSGVDSDTMHVHSAFTNFTHETSIAYNNDESASDTVTRTYNSFGQLLSEAQNHHKLGSSVGATISYSYSSVSTGSRLTTITYPSGRTVGYDYGSGLNYAISRLTSLTDSQIGSSPIESYLYLGLGTVIERTQDETGMKLTYIKQTGEATGDAGDPYIGLDRFGRVVDQRWIDASGTAVDRYQYTYDRDSNRTAKSNLLNSAFDEVYTYDDLNRLTQVDRNGSLYQSWDLDALGNMLSITDASGTTYRTYNDQNQLLTIGSTTLAYDNNGNMTTDDQGHTLIYDAWNHLVEVKNGSTTIQRFGYDGLGRMITVSHWMGGSETMNLYYSASWQVVAEVLGTGFDVEIENVFSPVFVDAPIFRDQDTDDSGYFTDPDERTYFVQDANYNVTAATTYNATTSAWEVAQRQVYDPYGSVNFFDLNWTSGSNAANVEFLHQGLRYDVTVGLYDNRARWYSDTLGKFGQPDPTGYIDGLALVNYLRNNPAIYRDAYGHQAGAETSPALPSYIRPPEPMFWNNTAYTSFFYKNGGFSFDTSTNVPPSAEYAQVNRIFTTIDGQKQNPETIIDYIPVDSLGKYGDTQEYEVGTACTTHLTQLRIITVYQLIYAAVDKPGDKTGLDWMDFIDEDDFPNRIESTLPPAADGSNNGIGLADREAVGQYSLLYSIDKGSGAVLGQTLEVYGVGFDRTGPRQNSPVTYRRFNDANPFSATMPSHSNLSEINFAL
jgi:RHS repeat-associated protein